MKDNEIKEIEEWLRDISTPTGLSYSGDRTLSNSMVDHIVDYITNLQEELEEEKRIEQEDFKTIQNLEEENRVLKELNVCVGCNNNPDYKSRNEKAIEYIKYSQSYGTKAQVMPHLKPYVNGDDLLEILGEDNEDK